MQGCGGSKSDPNSPGATDLGLESDSPQAIACCRRRLPWFDIDREGNIYTSEVNAGRRRRGFVMTGLAQYRRAARIRPRALACHSPPEAYIACI